MLRRPIGDVLGTVVAGTDAPGIDAPRPDMGTGGGGLASINESSRRDRTVTVNQAADQRWWER